MTVDLVSLAIIARRGSLPDRRQAHPNKLVPNVGSERTVFPVIAGALLKLQRNMTGAIVLTDAVGLLSDLGLAFCSC